jgi:cytochrome P450 family 109
LLGFCILLLAGNEATTTLLGNATWCFDDHPKVLDRLHADPALLPGAIEEVLRYRSPVKVMFRTATNDTLLGSEKIRASQSLSAWLGAANHDPAQFREPGRFDIRRTPSRHLAFGYGIHFCLGAPLARLEGRIALQTMLERLPSLRRDRNVPLEPLGSLILHGVKHILITFQA